MIKVTGHIQEDHFRTVVENGRNQLIADEPAVNHGTDLGFSPTEILCSALAACTCITLRMYADRKKWKLAQVRSTVSFSSRAENHVSHIEREIELSGELSQEQRQQLLEVAGHCPIHNILSNPIETTTRLIESVKRDT
jgi:putative redox protein